MNEEIIITIKFDPALGKVSFNGPLHQKVVCLGILEIAKEIVLKAGQGKIQIPSLILPKNLMKERIGNENFCGDKSV